MSQTIVAQLLITIRSVSGEVNMFMFIFWILMLNMWRALFSHNWGDFVYIVGRGGDMSDIVFWLADELKKKHAKFNHSWRSLEAALSRANGVTEPIMDRRKLKQLCNGEDVALRVSELKAINQFLEPEVSLCKKPIFTRSTNLLNVFSELDNICFFVATKYSKEIRSDTLSRWDFQGLRTILATPDLANAHFEIEEIFHHQNQLEKIQADKWIGKLDSEYSIISFGCPYVCHGSEKLMATMFNATPFATPGNYGTLPCYLVWPRKEERWSVDDSAFHMDLASFKSMFPVHSSDLTCDKRAIVLGGKVFISERIGTSYGLLIAQRRPGNRIFAVLCGTYGPTTFGMANLLADRQINVSLPPLSDKEHQPVLTAIIETSTIPINKYSSSIDRENRTLTNSKLHTPSLLWTLEDEQWIYKKIG